MSRKVIKKRRTGKKVLRSSTASPEIANAIISKLSEANRMLDQEMSKVLEEQQKAIGLLIKAVEQTQTVVNDLGERMVCLEQEIGLDEQKDVSDGATAQDGESDLRKVGDGGGATEVYRGTEGEKQGEVRETTSETADETGGIDEGS